jgi:hypothetical protein
MTGKNNAFADTATDQLIPGVPVAQLALIEPHLKARLAQRIANSACYDCILRRVAQEDRSR